MLATSVLSGEFVRTNWKIYPFKDGSSNRKLYNINRLSVLSQFEKEKTGVIETQLLSFASSGVKCRGFMNHVGISLSNPEIALSYLHTFMSSAGFDNVPTISTNPASFTPNHTED